MHWRIITEVKQERWFANGAGAEQLKKIEGRSAMTIPQAILFGAVLICASIIVSRLIAPYEIAGGATEAWRVNSMTGAVVLCSRTLVTAGAGMALAAGGCR